MQGQQAEELAAEYLQKHGYEIIARNWKTKWCEIDIVARQQKTIRFVEVKYRRSECHGRALEYITAAKVRQLRLAARAWISEYTWGGDCAIDAVGITGPLDEADIILVPDAVATDF